MPRKKLQPKPTPAAIKPEEPFRAWLLAGMTALLVARPLYPSESAAAHGDGLPLVMLWLALAAIWLLSVIHKSRVQMRFGAIDAAVLALIAWTSLSALHAVAFGSPRPSLNMFWEWIGLGLVYFLARQLISTPQEARSVVAAMIAVMTAIAVYGIYQYAVELPALQARFKSEGDVVLKEAGMYYPPGTPLRQLLEKRLANHVAIGTFAVTNSLAAVLAPWLVMGIGAVVAAWSNRRYRSGWLACLAPLAVCLVLTKSRSGAIAAGVGILLVAAMCLNLRLRHVVIATVAIGLLAAIGLFAAHNQTRFLRAAASLGYRVQYWRGALAMIRQRPWLGCGPGNFQDAYTHFKLPEASEDVADPHNFLLEVWATAGTPAALAFLAVLAIFSSRGAVVGWTSESVPKVARGEGRGEKGEGELPDRGKLVPLGALAGFLLALPLGMISSAPPSLAVTVIGLPAAAGCLWLLWPWVRGGRFPASLAALGIAVLLIALLTTEGIGLPSIAQSFWLLLALAAAPHLKFAPRWVAIVLFVLGAGLTITCFQTSYARVVPCQSFLRAAQREYLDGETDAAHDAAERAVAADGLSRDAHSLLAQIELDLWLSSNDPAHYEAFERNDALARQLAPESAAVWHGSAERYAKAFAATDPQGHRRQPGAIEQALISERRAVALYPNSSFEHAALAALDQRAGDSVGYRREARTAIELDDVMTFADKKLPEALRTKLQFAANSAK